MSVDHRKTSGYQCFEDALIEERAMHRWSVEHISLVMKKMERRRQTSSIPVVIYHIAPLEAKRPAPPTYNCQTRLINESRGTKGEDPTLGSPLQVCSSPIYIKLAHGSAKRGETNLAVPKFRVLERIRLQHPTERTYAFLRLVAGIFG